MKSASKILCLVLAAMMALPTLASCANDQNEDDKTVETGSATVEAGDDAPDFEEADFDEDEFKILWYGTTAADYADEYIWAESISGGAIGDAVAERNRRTEEMYNVKIAAEECGPMGEATKRMQAGQCDFELIYEWGIRSKAAALDGLLYDALELDTIDLEASYWVPSANESLTVGDHLFIFTNMITMNSLSWADMMYFNKMLMDKLNYTYPYDYVSSNSWTYDVLIPMVMGAEEDLNGDGEMDVEDQFGGVGGGSILGGLCAEPRTKDNGDGTYTVITYTEAMVAAYNEYSNRLSSIEDLSYEDVWAAGIDISRFESKHAGARFYLFGENHFLFMGGSIDMTKELVDMKEDYGVCPTPVKKAGDPFATGIDCNAPMFSMPIQLKDPEMTAMVLEYMAYQSEQILLPAYYETTIKTKRMQDTRDYDMLDIIRDSIVYDWTGVYLWDSELGVMRSQMLSAGHFKSVAARMEAKVQSEIDEVIEKLTSIDN